LLLLFFFQRSIAQEATELKEKATSVEEALSDVEEFLQRLQDLAEEVRNAFKMPHVKNLISNFKFLRGEDVSSSLNE